MMRKVKVNWPEVRSWVFVVCAVVVAAAFVYDKLRPEWHVFRSDITDSTGYSGAYDARTGRVWHSWEAEAKGPR
jgi:hypothetical protein